MKFVLLCYILSLCILTSFAQRQTSNWLFGNKVWLVFKADSVQKKFGSNMFAYESSSSISDKNGDLVLYSDGISVYDRNHKLITNDLKGNYSTSQGVNIIKSNYFDSIYYIFTNDYQGNSNGLCYSEIKLSKDTVIIKEKNKKNI